MRLHIIPIDKNQNILFFPDSVDYFTANNITTDLVSCISQDMEFETIKKKIPNLLQENFLEVKERITREKKQGITSIPESKLDRLIINISNDCNMRCKYCYANQGTYGKYKNMISEEMLKIVLDKFFQIFSQIGMIQLFGGEPTMNMGAIEYACKYIKNQGYNTHVGMVTNASLINEKFIDMVNKYNLDITVSVDVEKVHDKLRPFPNEVNSWEKIRNNIHKLQMKTHQPTQIELTYTKVHEDNHISIQDALIELQEEYGDIPVHVTPVCSDDRRFHLRNRYAFITSIHELYNQKVMGKSLSYSWLKSYELNLKHKETFDYFCGAGISTLAVATHGDIYPCFYFTDNEDYRISNINENIEDIRNAILKKRDFYYINKKSTNEKCKDCFANTLCNGCLGANLSETGAPFEASEEHCNMVKDMIEGILKEIVFKTQEKG